MGNQRDLPPAVQLHIIAYVRSADIDGAANILGNPCTGCPAEHTIANAQPDDSPPCCYSCPLWGLRVDLAQLRLMRRLELGGI